VQNPPYPLPQFGSKIKNTAENDFQFARVVLNEYLNFHVEVIACQITFFFYYESPHQKQMLNKLPIECF